MESQYILSQIENDSDKATIPLKSQDIELIESADKSIPDPEYKARNELYTHLLDDYISSNKSKTQWKKWYKFAFFTISMFVFMGVIAVSLISILLVAKKDQATLSDLGVVVSGIAGILSVLIIIPKVIAEHLFPTDEDSHMIGMVKNMQLNDSGIRNHEKARGNVSSMKIK